VADQAIVDPAFERGSRRGTTLVEDAEHCPRLWIHGGNFEDAGGLAEAHVNVIAEVDREWCAW